MMWLVAMVIVVVALDLYDIVVKCIDAISGYCGCQRSTFRGPKPGVLKADPASGPVF